MTCNAVQLTVCMPVERTLKLKSYRYSLDAILLIVLMRRFAIYGMAHLLDLNLQADISSRIVK
jgi:hypothetical protein